MCEDLSDAADKGALVVDSVPVGSGDFTGTEREPGGGVEVVGGGVLFEHKWRVGAFDIEGDPFAEVVKPDFGDEVVVDDDRAGDVTEG